MILAPTLAFPWQPNFNSHFFKILIIFLKSVLFLHFLFHVIVFDIDIGEYVFGQYIKHLAGKEIVLESQTVCRKTAVVLVVVYRQETEVLQR